MTNTRSTPTQAVSIRDGLIVELDYLRRMLAEASAEQLVWEAANMQVLNQNCWHMRSRLEKGE